jgi:hypothetical protein
VVDSLEVVSQPAEDEEHTDSVDHSVRRDDGKRCSAFSSHISGKSTSTMVVPGCETASSVVRAK